MLKQNDNKDGMKAACTLRRISRMTTPSGKREYIMTIYRLEHEAQVSESEKALLERAKTLPVVYDDDSPELTEEMEKAFIAARRQKPYRNTKADPVASA